MMYKLVFGSRSYLLFYKEDAIYLAFLIKTFRQSDMIISTLQNLIDILKAHPNETPKVTEA